MKVGALFNLNQNSTNKQYSLSLRKKKFKELGINPKQILNYDLSKIEMKGGTKK